MKTEIESLDREIAALRIKICTIPEGSERFTSSRGDLPIVGYINALHSENARLKQALMDMIDMAADPEGKEARDPLADSKAELNRQYKNWLETLKYFDGKPDTLTLDILTQQQS